MTTLIPAAAPSESRAEAAPTPDSLVLNPMTLFPLPQPLASPARQIQPRPSPPPQPAAQPAAGGAPGGSGRQSDRDSEPASTQTIGREQFGQPLAARGLRILTRSARFSYYTQLTARPRDPLFRLHFGRDGEVKNVEILRSSGYPDIDRPIIDSLWRWRAEGEALKSLLEPPAKPSTLAFEFRILL
ncbi:MAG: hypothetical protein IBJ11_11740 [Phycisphaerales bacterium]|nr:hypothetical protein [Phycisphaerales bacterium]